MSSDPDRRRLRPTRITRAVIAALCAVSLTLAPLVAPSAGLAQSPHFGGPLPSLAPLPPPDKPPGGGGGGGSLCRSELCRRIVEKFCTSNAIKALGGCVKLAQKLVDARKGSAFVRGVLRDAKDLAFKRPYSGKDFEVHHIVPQGRPFGGVADFAQSILERVGIKVDEADNLSALRGPLRKVGMDGYKMLSKTRIGRILQKRIAHADAQTKYYYETVNERFAARFAKLIEQGKEPTKSEVEALLKQIKEDLYNGGKDFIERGKAPR